MVKLTEGCVRVGTIEKHNFIISTVKARVVGHKAVNTSPKSY